MEDFKTKEQAIEEYRRQEKDLVCGRNIARNFAIILSTVAWFSTLVIGLAAMIFNVDIPIMNIILFNIKVVIIAVFFSYSAYCYFFQLPAWYNNQKNKTIAIPLAVHFIKMNIIWMGIFIFSGLIVLTVILFMSIIVLTGIVYGFFKENHKEVNLTS